MYRKQHPDEGPILSFDVDIVRGWLDYNPTNIPNEYSKAENALLHLGNLDALFGNGSLYDSSKDAAQRDQYLTNIRQRFRL